MLAIHFICKREGSSLKGVSFDKSTKLFSSAHWDISKSQADTLIGGWIYLHQHKASHSEFGGIVRKVEVVTDETLSHSERVVFILEKRPEGTGQKWRGKDHARAHSSNFVEANLPHERESAHA